MTLMTHKGIVLVHFKELWSKKTNSHTWMRSYGWVLNVEPDSICLTKALYWVFHWGCICAPKVCLLPIFWLQSGNKCFIPGVDSFWASWKVDSCLGLTEQVKWPMWCCERVSKGNQVNFFLAASIIGDADDLQWVKDLESVKLADQSGCFN
jgi:hypothetical protein